MTETFLAPQTTNTHTIAHGDACELVENIDNDFVDFTIFSPPFSSLYTYTDSPRDMGNCRDDAEFLEHFKFLTSHLLRITKPGRLVSIHCMNLPAFKALHGYVGLRDFRGDIIRAFVDAGFIFHSEVCIWKDPVLAMQRTKALGLLHKQLVKDSCMSRMGIPDYLVTMRKPGQNHVPVRGPLTAPYLGLNPPPISEDPNRRSIDIWQRYASPVWDDIDPQKTLQYMSARGSDDERHICPLQLQVIERAIVLWSNPGEIVLSPFAGIGSEGYVAIKRRRRFIGFELKESYFKVACGNLLAAESEQADLFEDKAVY